MKIEIDQADYQQIQDRICAIKIEAIQAKTGTDQQRQDCMDHTLGWACEITMYLHRGVLIKGDG